MLKWIVIALVGLIGIVGLVAAVGLLLPKGHSASRTVTLAAPPEAVYGAITDVVHHPEWRSDLKSVEILPDDGRGLRFREVGKHGPIAFRFEVMESNRRVVTRIADPTLPFGGTWTFDLKPAGAGTELTITEDGEVYNPIFRTMSKLMSQTASIEAYMAGLEKRLSKDLPP